MVLDATMIAAIAGLLGSAAACSREVREQGKSLVHWARALVRWWRIGKSKGTRTGPGAQQGEVRHAASKPRNRHRRWRRV